MEDRTPVKREVVKETLITVSVKLAPIDSARLPIINDFVYSFGQLLSVFIKQVGRDSDYIPTIAKRLLQLNVSLCVMPLVICVTLAVNLQNNKQLRQQEVYLVAPYSILHL